MRGGDESAQRRNAEETEEKKEEETIPGADHSAGVPPSPWAEELVQPVYSPVKSLVCSIMEGVTTMPAEVSPAWGPVFDVLQQDPAAQGANGALLELALSLFSATQEAATHRSDNKRFVDSGGVFALFMLARRGLKQPALGDDADAAAGAADDGAGGPTRVAFHQHPVQAVPLGPGYGCDKCGRADDRRLQCASGCDFDLCGSCFDGEVATLRAADPFVLFHASTAIANILAGSSASPEAVTHAVATDPLALRTLVDMCRCGVDASTASEALRAIYHCLGCPCDDDHSLQVIEAPGIVECVVSALHPQQDTSVLVVACRFLCLLSLRSDACEGLLASPAPQDGDAASNGSALACISQRLLQLAKHPEEKVRGGAVDALAQLCMNTPAAVTEVVTPVVAQLAELHGIAPEPSSASRTGGGEEGAADDTVVPTVREAKASADSGEREASLRLQAVLSVPTGTMRLEALTTSAGSPVWTLLAEDGKAVAELLHIQHHFCVDAVEGGVIWLKRGRRFARAAAVDLADATKGGNDVDQAAIATVMRYCEPADFEPLFVLPGVARMVLSLLGHRSPDIGVVAQSHLTYALQGDHGAELATNILNGFGLRWLLDCVVTPGSLEPGVAGPPMPAPPAAGGAVEEPLACGAAAARTPELQLIVRSLDQRHALELLLSFVSAKSPAVWHCLAREDVLLALLETAIDKVAAAHAPTAQHSAAMGYSMLRGVAAATTDVGAWPGILAELCVQEAPLRVLRTSEQAQRSLVSCLQTVSQPLRSAAMTALAPLLQSVNQATELSALGRVCTEALVALATEGSGCSEQAVACLRVLAPVDSIAAAAVAAREPASLDALPAASASLSDDGDASGAGAEAPVAEIDASAYDDAYEVSGDAYDEFDDLAGDVEDVSSASGYGASYDASDFDEAPDARPAPSPGVVWGASHRLVAPPDATAPESHAAVPAGGDPPSGSTAAGAGGEPAAAVPASESGATGMREARATVTAQLDALPEREWNEEWQNLLSRLREEVTVDRRCKILEETNTLIQEFAATAATLAELIVAGMFSEELRVVPTLDAGGVAGGTKYLAKNVFIKFVEFDERLFADYSVAARVAHHEFRALEAIRCIRQPLIHTGLQVLLDVCGFRCSATAALPIDGSTLVYGSADAAAAVATSEAGLNAAIAAVAHKLNLAAHYVGRGERRYLVHGPADLEGHLGRDGNYYVVDTSRLMPPLPPAKSLKGSQLMRLMRPELVAKHDKPLSSDSFTGFGTHHAMEHNTEARRAANRLYQHIIPSLANEIDRNSDELIKADESHVRVLLHSHGINMHMLGMVRCHLSNPVGRAVMLTMMAARVAKTDLRAIMRRTCQTSGTVVSTTAAPLRRAAARYLNALISSSGGSTFWLSPDGMKKRLQSKFAFALSDEESGPSFDLRTRIASRLMLLALTVQSCGIRLVDGLLERLGDSWEDDTGASPEEVDVVIKDGDIVACEPVVHTPELKDPVAKYMADGLADNGFGDRGVYARRVAAASSIRLTRAATGGRGESYVNAALAAAVSTGATDPQSVVSSWTLVSEAATATYGALHIKTLMAIRNSAGGYAMQGRYSDTLPLLRKFVKWTKRLAGAYASVANSYAQIATYTTMLGGMENVLAGFEAFKATDDMIARHVSQHQNHPLKLDVFSFIRQVVGQLASPENPHCVGIIQALDNAAQSVFGEVSALNVPVLFSAARTLNALGDATAAQEWLERALVLQLTGYPDSDSAVLMVDTLAYAGILANRRGDAAGAAEQFRRSIAVMRAALEDTAGAPGAAPSGHAAAALPPPRPPLSRFVFFPSCFGELAVLEAATGDYGTAMGVMNDGFELLQSRFADDMSYAGAVSALERYWPGVLPPDS